MDHQGQCLHFGEAGLEGDASMRHQLQTLAASLVKVTKQQQQALAQQQQQAQVQAAREAQRLAFFKKVGVVVVWMVWVWVWVWVWMCGWVDTYSVVVVGGVLVLVQVLVVLDVGAIYIYIRAT